MIHLKSPILGGNLGLFGPLFVPDTCTPLDAHFLKLSDDVLKKLDLATEFVKGSVLTSIKESDRVNYVASMRERVSDANLMMQDNKPRGVTSQNKKRGPKSPKKNSSPKWPKIPP